MPHEKPEYFRAEWELFHNNPDRAKRALDAVSGIKVERVLDVGCGAGQELLPFVMQGALGFGVDLHPGAASAGSELYGPMALSGRVFFIRAEGERIPCRSGSMDAVVCRIALPYMHNPSALSEIQRVLRPGGILIVKIHHLKYYGQELAKALSKFHIKGVIHAFRVITTGTIYWLTRRHMVQEPIFGETFQTRTTVARELSQMSYRGSLEESTSTPTLVFVKTG